MAEVVRRRRSPRKATQKKSTDSLTVALSGRTLVLKPLKGEALRFATGYAMGLLADAVATAPATQTELSMRVAQALLKSRAHCVELLAIVAESVSPEDRAAFVRELAEQCTPPDYVALCVGVMSLCGVNGGGAANG